MNRLATFSMVSLIAIVLTLYATGAFAQHFIVTNDDNLNSGHNSATFFPINTNGNLGPPTTVSTGGTGLAGGLFSVQRISVLNKAQKCVWVTNGGDAPGDITGINAVTRKVTGRFPGSSNDSGALYGTGLAGSANGRWLYASFTASNTIAQFDVLTGCTLKFAADTNAVGLNGVPAVGMRVSPNNKLLVVAFGDGSIQSFAIGTDGTLTANSDKQLSIGYNKYGQAPASVDITKDGHWAVFGDDSFGPAVLEVYDISGGTLNGSTAVAYIASQEGGAQNLAISPDETEIYYSSPWSGTLGQNSFDASTGVIGSGCTSHTLNGYNYWWSYVGQLSTQVQTGNGTVLYVAEEGQNRITRAGQSYIGSARVAASGCRLIEFNSLKNVDNFGYVLSIATYPPRSF
jgi:Lactonase, 7-bladed beta-propeller